MSKRETCFQVMQSNEILLAVYKTVKGIGYRCIKHVFGLSKLRTQSVYFMVNSIIKRYCILEK